jgi:hypothetical protein
MTAAACCLAVLLAGCATTNGPVPMPQAPAPVETPDVKAVKAMVLPIDDTVTVAEAFAQYGSCRPGSQVWEEIEDGDVQFSCTFDDGALVQFDFRKGDDEKFKIAMVTFTSMNDAEFAGVSVRGPDAEDMLKRVYFNKKLF